MKIKIDKRGYLFLERGGAMKEQGCPFGPIYDQRGVLRKRTCGDWCPLFGEPITTECVPAIEVPPLTSIALCEKGMVTCHPSDFTDERGKE